MSLYIASLNSGSNGNCYYIGNDHEAVLVDTGISCRETQKRMKRLGLAMEKIKAIFISHEHIDHIRGLPAITEKFRIPVYITAATLHNSRMSIMPELVKPFRHHEPVQVGGLKVNAFSKHHDAMDPHSFTIEGSGITVGVFTDIGISCDRLVHSFQQCHAAFLEANYDEAMLENGGYPIYLKNRIRGGKGHLSNRQALELYMAHKPAFMSHLLLSHLSKNNNTPEVASELFRPHAGNTHIVVASRYNESEVYKIEGKPASPVKTQATKSRHAVQSSLF